MDPVRLFVISLLGVSLLQDEAVNVSEYKVHQRGRDAFRAVWTYFI